MGVCVLIGDVVVTTITKVMSDSTDNGLKLVIGFGFNGLQSFRTL